MVVKIDDYHESQKIIFKYIQDMMEILETIENK